MPPLDKKSMEQCAETCHKCRDACLRTIISCLDMGGEHASRAHQTMLMDCADVCGVSHTLLHRQSPQHVHTCRACAEICRACTKDCEQTGNGDKQMQDCAKACRECADSCERMASAHA